MLRPSLKEDLVTFFGSPLFLLSSCDIPGDCTVTDLDFSARCRRCMERLNVVSLADLIKYTAKDLLACPNLGQTSLREIEEKLAEFDLQLRQEEEAS